MFKKKILVIDDSILMLKMISDILDAGGYEVITLSDSTQGIDTLRKTKPDLVLLDIVMPKVDGFEICKLLREDDSNNLLPIIMLTAQNNEEDKLKGLELGADDYITKPFNPRELLSRVKNTLRRIDRNRWANPLTGLKGNNEILAEIEHRIATGELFAVAYLDLDNFKAYNDVYDFIRGDNAIKMTADIINDNVKMLGDQHDFIGHIGGDDFIIVTIPSRVDDICSSIIYEFDNRIKSLYNKEDGKKGYIETKDRQGNIIRFPIMSISIAVITNEKRKFKNIIQIADLSMEVKKKAKLIQGSVYVKDKRTD